ncbi:MAG: HAD hydrolase-like protein, partial [Acidobacteria bacterium]|nr:HAD hydrolase-like protein [Acidobacteriota bacterium]
GTPVSRAERLKLARLGRQIREMPIEFLPGVLETLPRLRERFRLILFTKGHPPEQRRKVERSRIAPLFHHLEFTAEKDRQAYVRLVDRHRLHPPSTWMVGNSPRSDINPALAAGLNAILIPHPRTWELEHEEVDGESERLRVIARFEELLRIF